MKSFIRLCIEHPLSVIMLYIALILFGLVSFPRLRGEYLPTIYFPEIRVITEFENISAEEVERQVTVPLENVLSGVSGVKEIESLSRQGISSVLLRFSWGTDVQRATIEVREKIDSAFPYLPYGIEKPLVFIEEASDNPPFILIARPKESSLQQQFHRTIRYDLKTRLMQIDGISTVKLRGITTPEIKVYLDADKCATAGLSITDIPPLIAGTVFELPAGKIVEDDTEYLIKTTTDIETLADLRSMPISSSGGGSLTLGDLATVELGSAEKTSFFSFDGRAAVGVFLWESPHTGTLKASENLSRELKSIRRSFANDMDIVLLHDEADRIRTSFQELGLALLLGGAAAFAVILLFLRSFRTAFILLMSIPAAILPVFFMQYLLDLSLNVMSLTGVAIGIGMIVDNSIVVLERIQGDSDTDRITEGVFEMGSSTFGSTMTTLLVFLPVVFVPGIIGLLFRELAITVSLLLIFAFLVSMTLIPAMYVLSGCQNKMKPITFFKRSETKYGRALRYLIKHPMTTIGIIAGVLIVIPVIGKTVPLETMPFVVDGSIPVRISLPANTSFEQVEEKTKAFVRTLLENKSITSVYAYAGYESDNPLGRAREETSLTTAFLSIGYQPRESSVHEQASDAIRETIRESPQLSLEWEQGSDPIGKLLSAGGGTTLRFSGEDRDEVIAASLKYHSLLRERFPATLLQTGLTEEYTEVLLEPDTFSCIHSGISPSAIAGTLRTAVRGVESTKMTIDDEEMDIRVMTNENQYAIQTQLDRIRVKTQSGFVSLSHLGKITHNPTQRDLNRYNRLPCIYLSFIGPPVDSPQLPGYGSNVHVESISQNAFTNSLNDILFIFCIALLLIYLFLGAQFESFTSPLLLMIVLPLSVAGSIVLLSLTGRTLNVNSGIGILILFGTTINTTILMNASLRSARSLEEYVRKAKTRFRPVFLTTATTITALFPLFLNTSPEGTLQSHTATALIGGLFLGTLLSLLCFPPLLAYVNKIDRSDTHGDR
jgi:multidrug efflux pump subunit AcrB